MHYYVDVVEREPRAGSAAWSRRYAELQPRLVRALAATAGTYVGVEDAVHDAFAAALSADRAQIDNLGGWLYTVALRTLRRAQRRDAIARALRLPRAPISGELERAVTRIDLLADLATLSARERELLIARHYFGLTQDELATSFHMPRGTVSATLSRAAAKLRARERTR
jgi:RNA polymerase sigma factor (sigma-70 family)